MRPRRCCEANDRTEAILTLTSNSGLRRLSSRWFPPIAVVMCTAVVSACKVDLYTELDQRQANEMVALLAHHGIAADRTIGKGDLVSVAVDETRFAEAITILDDNGLPKQKFASLGEVFKKDGLVSSPVQERAQMIYALSQELSRTISDIDGVVSARVHLVLPENDPLRQQLVPSSASVFIRHKPDMQLTGLVPQVKQLVANGISGLSYDKVSVILRPVETESELQFAQSERSSEVAPSRENIALAGWPLYGALSVIAIAAASFFGLRFWRQRHRVYSLSVPDEAPSP
jgi:type III secretion protein J